jgi:guanyl-specific ribonuclease Sa
MNGMTAPSGGRSRAAPLTPLRGLLLLALVLLGLWLTRNADQPPRPVERPASVASSSPEEPLAELPEQRPAAEPAEAALATEVPNVTLRDLDGQVVFRGTVDVQSTLDRIAAGKRLDYRNDGSTFENRERRLPRKPSGYYREYVHPTPSLAGPGPQRLVVGQQGEVYYTPDHYRTFKRVR